jgi:hypothetical protein
MYSYIYIYYIYTYLFIKNSITTILATVIVTPAPHHATPVKEMLTTVLLATTQLDTLF